MRRKEFAIRRSRLYLNVLRGMALLLMPCILFTSCMEEKQLDELVQQTNKAGAGVETPPTESVEPEAPLVALPGLPEDVAGYERWLKLNAEPIPPAKGGDPHLGTKNVYVNQIRATLAPNGEQQFPYPDGSIVVKEAYRPDKEYVGLIAIMRKSSGTDPDHNDWEFIEYTRNAPDAEFREIASGGICWGCHARVEDIDYVFTVLD